MTTTWRDKARPIIASVIERVGTDDMRTLRRELRKAFPFGARELHPYRIWRHECRVQLGEVRRFRARVISPMTGQGKLFDS